MHFASNFQFAVLADQALFTKQVSNEIHFVKRGLERIAHTARQNPQEIGNNLESYLVDLQLEQDLEPTISNFLQTNANNYIINSLVPHSAQASLETRDYIRLCYANPNVAHVGMPVYGAISKAWSIPIGVGIRLANGKYAGAIIAGINIEHLTHKLLATKNNNALQGVNFVPFVPFAEEPKTDLSEHINNFHALQLVQAILFTNQPTLVFSATVDTLPAHIELEYSTAAIRSQYFSETIVNMLLICLLVSATIVVGMRRL